MKRNTCILTNLTYSTFGWLLSVYHIEFSIEIVYNTGESNHRDAAECRAVLGTFGTLAQQLYICRKLTGQNNNRLPSERDSLYSPVQSSQNSGQSAASSV